MLRWTFHCEVAQLSGELARASAEERAKLLCHGRSDGYMMSQLVELQTCCSADVVRAALAHLVRRHAILRTHYSFNATTNHFDQLIRAEDGFVVPLTICTKAAEWQACVHRTGAEPFDLLTTPPFRAALLLGESTGDSVIESPTRMSITLHHVSTDNA